VGCQNRLFYYIYLRYKMATKSRPLLVLTGTLVVLVVAFLLVKRYVQPARERLAYYPMKGVEVERVEITRNDTCFVFEKRDDGWWMVSPLEYPALEWVMKQLAEKAPDIAIGREVITCNPDEYEKYGITEESRIVKFAGGRRAVELKIGKEAPQGLGYYVIWGNRPCVRIAKLMPKYLLERGMTRWWNRKVFKFEPSDIVRVAIEYDDTTYVLERDTVWYLNGEMVDSNKVKGYLRYITNLQAIDFVPEAKIESEDTLVTVTISVPEDIHVAIGEYDVNNYWMTATPMRMPGGYRFKISKWQLKQIKNIKSRVKG